MDFPIFNRKYKVLEEFDSQGCKKNILLMKDKFREQRKS